VCSNCGQSWSSGEKRPREGQDLKNRLSPAEWIWINKPRRTKRGISYDSLHQRYQEAEKLVLLILRDRLDVLLPHACAPEASTQLHPMAKDDSVALSVLVGLTDEQYVTLREILQAKYPLSLPAKSTMAGCRRSFMQNLDDQLKLRPLERPSDGIIGVMVGLPAVLAYLYSAYGAPQASVLMWKLSADGRPNGPRSEISLGITPLSFVGEILQSANAVYPLMLFQGQSNLITTLSKISNR
jgi:hypothetical protein